MKKGILVTLADGKNVVAYPVVLASVKNRRRASKKCAGRVLQDGKTAAKTAVRYEFPEKLCYQEDAKTIN